MPGRGFWEAKRKVARHYDRLAPIYNALYGHEQSLKIKRSLGALEIEPSDVVLDVGCGTGLLFRYIARSVKMVVGVDISLASLRVARGCARDYGLNNVFLVRADADFLPFRSNVFDKVFAITLLQNMPNPSLTLNEIARVAKDGSEMVITGLKKAFSRKFFTEIIEASGVKFSLLDDAEDISCHIAVCYKGGGSKSINTWKLQCNSLVVEVDANTRQPLKGWES